MGCLWNRSNSNSLLKFPSDTCTSLPKPHNIHCNSPATYLSFIKGSFAGSLAKAHQDYSLCVPFSSWGSPSSLRNFWRHQGITPVFAAFQNIVLKITCQLSWALSGLQIHSCFSTEESESLFCKIKRNEDSKPTAQGGVWKVSDANLTYSQEVQLFPPLQGSCPCCCHIFTSFSSSALSAKDSPWLLGTPRTSKSSICAPSWCSLVWELLISAFLARSW